MSHVSAIKASLESAHDRSPPPVRASARPSSWHLDSQEHANLSPIVKNGSLRRQHGHVRLTALRQLARNGAIRVPTADTAGRRHSSLPREVLDRSLPPVPPVPTGLSKSGQFAVKRKSVPDARDPLPPTPNMPSWVKETNSPRPVTQSTPSTPDTQITPSRPLPIPSPSPKRFTGTRPLSIVRSPKIATPVEVVSPVVGPAAWELAEATPERVRQIPGARVKEAVKRIENIAPSPTKSQVSTPVRAIGVIAERPCPVSSTGLSSEARRIMAEARLRRLAKPKA